MTARDAEEEEVDVELKTAKRVHGGTTRKCCDQISQEPCSALDIGIRISFYLGITSDGELGPRMIRCGRLDGYWE